MLNCITDAGEVAELIQSAVQGATCNACINLMDIDDTNFCTKMKPMVLKSQKDVLTRTDKIRKKSKKPFQWSREHDSKNS
jgi:formiminotetrahydrofolate cyclodeaminase